MLPLELLDINTYDRIKTFIENQDLTPLLVVLGGSASLKTPSSKPDIDLISYHLESEPRTIDFPDIDVRTMLNVAVDRSTIEYISLQSHSLSYARSLIFELPTRVPRTTHVIENMLGLTTIIYDSEHEDLQTLKRDVAEIPVSVLIEHYTVCANEYKREIDTYQDYYYDKIILRAIRFELARKHFKETGAIEVRLDRLIDWAGISFDFSSFVPTFRREASFWKPIINEVFT